MRSRTIRSERAIDGKACLISAMAASASLRLVKSPTLTRQ